MASKINLYFETFKEPEFETEVIRLKTYLKFRTIENWTEPFEGIIDTGAYTSVVPLSIWKRILFKSIKRIKIQGLSPKPECSIPAIKAKINCIILDEQGNYSRELEATSYLALIDDIPLIVGFRNILSIFKVTFNYRAKKAYLNI